MALLEELQRKKGLASLLPGKGGERIKPLPPTRRPIGEPIPFRPTIPAEQEPGRIRDLRPPGVSLRALKMKRQQLREQLRQIEAQILSLSGRRGNMIDIGPGGEPPPPPLDWDRPRPPVATPIGPPTMPGPPSIGPGTPIPQPPPMPPRPIPPWGG